MEFTQVRRRNPCIIEIGDELVPDIAALLGGRIEIEASVRIWLLCPLRGERVAVTRDELDLLAQLVADRWTPVDAVIAEGKASAEQLRSMAGRGLLITDSDAPLLRDDRLREERLRGLGWHGLAAVYHARTRWSEVQGDEGSRDHSEEAHLARLARSVARNGLPPPHLPTHAESEIEAHLPLPATPREGPLWDLLRARETTRAFRTGEWLPAAELAAVLEAAFAPLGQRALGPGLVALRRSSPSGGGLHPIEAYVIAVRVGDVPCGLYHYEGARQRLARLKQFDEAEARSLVERFTIGQTFFAEAHALVLHVARAHRNFWKYRRHPKAYKVLFADAGHLSQSFYLAAASRGLGAFYTGAINDADLCAWIGLDPLEHVVVGANGLGIRDDTRQELHLRPGPMPVEP